MLIDESCGRSLQVTAIRPEYCPYSEPDWKQQGALLKWLEAMLRGEFVDLFATEKVMSLYDRRDHIWTYTLDRLGIFLPWVEVPERR